MESWGQKKNYSTLIVVNSKTKSISQNWSSLIKEYIYDYLVSFFFFVWLTIEATGSPNYKKRSRARNIMESFYCLWYTTFISGWTWIFPHCLDCVYLFFFYYLAAYSKKKNQFLRYITVIHTVLISTLCLHSYCIDIHTVLWEGFQKNRQIINFSWIGVFLGRVDSFLEVSDEYN